MRPPIELDFQRRTLNLATHLTQAERLPNRCAILHVIDRPAPLTVQELAAELGCSVDEVRALIRDGELHTVACGIRPGRVPRHEIDAYLRRRQFVRGLSGNAASAD
jgi:excisionase family DNA binding protein